MTSRPLILMTDPGHYEVSYQINPWMRPDAWAECGATRAEAARGASAALCAALQMVGAQVEILAGKPGLPDMVFPANAAVVLDGVALMAHFRHPERQGEEAPFRQGFEALRARRLIDEIVALPPGLFQEGAGDAHWDAHRQLFWTGYGPRSAKEATPVIAEVFGQEVVALELATQQFYHLDTCFCPLPGGEVLYFPPAFTEAGRAAIAAFTDPEQRIEASPDEAGAFCVNAVCLGRTVVMAKAPARLKAILAERGYRVVEIDLSPFILSGGAAFCMTLRLDQTAARTRPALPFAANA
ncbi:dimethylarginine dimethylaminohydrolase family protein [Phenylobacterium sp.]|jgi:N-dimethylarginine dimethylaminohydrolase|uniref:dimethylarginine dimethylaminohydrolase family protein n=1 Tax=Phenylobacterium sp. TaxID=1871053 RepID=UPI002E31701F|nr:arginine deiminase-related protein [Phenylobacterium sp.]HEX2561217.1 arginine deiminase-related protein [Phenylobacterium sp.]